MSLDRDVMYKILNTVILNAGKIWLTGTVDCVTGYKRTEEMQPREKHGSEIWKAEITKYIL